MHKAVSRLGILSIFALLATIASLTAQSLTTGAITGTIHDATGAVIPNTPVTVKSLETGASQVTQTGGAGDFQAPLLKPGAYTVSAAQTGFKTAERTVTVQVGQTVVADLNLELGQSTQTIEVTAEAPLINPDPSNNTAFTATQVSLLPSAGGDLTNIAFTAPGVVVNVTGGFGNFTANGLPATSNLFTINGENNMDPYFNTNNSGATNLTLGQNEIQEATVITNPYAGNYGQLSGAQVTYITKSGSNEFHGNAQWLWNGRFLNANDWFNNSGLYGAPTDRPFDNANQWSDSVGGPIWKNQTFFFVDNEGMRFVLPNVDTITIPGREFANAVLSNVQLNQPAEFQTYQKMFQLWQGTPGAGGATPVPNTSACKALTIPGFNPATQNCAQSFQSTPSARSSEWILAFRIDQRLGNNDNAYFRYKQDDGLQPSNIDAVSPNFNAISNQPSWDTQVNETHVFGPRATNSFMASLSYYRAIFSQNHQLASSTFPYAILTLTTVPFTSFNPMYAFPEGRNITQYQIIDDYSLTRGSHNLKFGVNFRRYDVSDHNFTFNSPAVYFGFNPNGLSQFANGLAFQYRLSLNQANDVPVALWGMGLYGMDEWKVNADLKLTLALRVEHNSNPVCNFNCFANFAGPWTTLPSYTSSNPANVPYSSDIKTGLHQAYQGTDAINWSPRIGFSWSPFHDTKTVLSGGIGVFYDNLAAGLVDSLLGNIPATVSLRVRPGAGVPAFDPGPKGGAAIWQASASAFNIQQTYTQLSNKLKSLGVPFAPPAFTALVGTLHSPQFQEWNLMIQREVSNSVLLSVNYVGNHGIHIPYGNGWPNAFDLYGLYPGVPGIPAVPTVPNYGTVTTWQSGAISNYHGLTVTVAKRFARGLQGHFNYTWSHNLDELSNGGIFTYGDSVLGQINPLSLRANNYGNSDYDIRHNFNADLVYAPVFHVGNRLWGLAVNGWQLSTKVYWRSGLPFSVFDGGSGLSNGGGSIFATPIAGGGPVQNGACGASAVTTPCINANAFLNSFDANFSNFTAWSPQTRNQFRGPRYFDVDLSLFKQFKMMKERAALAVGMQAFNVLNHPNFGLPDSTFGDGRFGLLTGMANTPTSPYGVLLGFDSGPRLVQLSAKLTF